MARAAHATEDGLDVAIVVQLAGDSSSDLRENLVINSRRPLVDDKQRHLKLAHLASDGAEDRLAGGLWIQELVSFLDRDHELRRGRLGTSTLAITLSQLTPQAVDSTGDDIRDQHVG